MRVAFAQAGAGPDLVLLHGGMDDSRVWRHQLEGLSDAFRVLDWDAPGSGGTPDAPAMWRMPEFADCAAEWLDEIGVERAHVLGLSWGSSVALALYHRHPALVRSLILASAYAGWMGSLPRGEVAARVEGALDEGADEATVRSMAEADLRDVLPTITVPTLLLFGELDDRSPVTTVGAELHARIPNAQLAVIPEVGHMSNLEAPEAFNAAVRAFLRNLA